MIKSLKNKKFEILSYNLYEENANTRTTFIFIDRENDNSRTEINREVEVQTTRPQC
jgi:hypothetical protein